MLHYKVMREIVDHQESYVAIDDLVYSNKSDTTFSQE